MTQQQPKRKGLVEWGVVLLPVMVLGAGMLMSYTRLDDRVDHACTTFTDHIQRIEDKGTALSTKNEKNICILQTQFEAIDARLQRMEDAQNKAAVNQEAILRLLQQ